MANASIYGAIQPVRPVNRLAELGQVMQVQGMQQDAAMNRLKMDEYQRGIGEQNALAKLMADPANYKEGRFDVEGAAPKLYQVAPSKAAGVLKGFSDQRKADADYRKVVLDEITKRTELAGQAFGAVRQNPTVENVYATLDHLGQSGVFDPQRVASLKGQVNPQNAAAFVDQMFRMALGAKEQLAKVTTTDTGQTTDTIATDPVTGQTRMVNQIQNTVSPNTAATVAASKENAAATRSVAQATKEAAQISADSKRTTDLEMKLADDYRTESKGFAETSTAMKKVLAAIETADKNPGSALAAGTGFMKILDPTSVVRETELGMALNASGWFDRATNIANTLQSGRVMTATQKQNLKKAAEDLFEEAKAAQREIDAAYNKRATDYRLDPKRIIVDRGQNTTRPAAASAGPVKLTAANADAEYAKLPSGAEFIAPDGSRRRKP